MRDAHRRWSAAGARGRGIRRGASSVEVDARRPDPHVLRHASLDRRSARRSSGDLWNPSAEPPRGRADDRG
jgi:hypothetical protein